MKISAIIVAAGRSSRFECGNKLLAEIDGKPIIGHVIDETAASRVGEIIVVTPPDGAEIVQAAGTGRWRITINANAGVGLSSSIAAGVSAVDAASDGVLIVLADMPRVTATLIDQLCDAFVSNGGTAVVFPHSPDGRQGNPVLWPRSLFGELMEVTGDRGGKAVLAAHQELHLPMRIDGDAAFADVDTNADLAAITRHAI